MLNWFKRILGIGPSLPAAVDAIDWNKKENAPAPKKAKAPKKATKKKSKEDLSAMTKTQLLNLCKERGVKANASLNKAELLKRLG